MIRFSLHATADTGSAKKCKIMLIGGHSRLNSIDSITISTDGNLPEKVKSSVSYIGIVINEILCMERTH